MTWWTLPKSEMGGEIKSLLDGYKRDQAGRRIRFLRNLSLYERRSMSSYSAHAYQSSDEGDARERDRLGLVRSAISSAVANIYAPQKPKPQFQTLGATWATRRKAYKLDRICEGILNQRQGRWINVWALIMDAAVDAPLQGTMAVKVVADRRLKRIVHSIVPCCDIYTDPAEGREPLSWFHREPISVSSAEELYPKLRTAINGAQPYDWGKGALSQRPRSEKVIEIVYGWKLPEALDDDGKMCVSINGETAEVGDWSAPMPPFVFLHWEPHRDGPWGAGICDEGGNMAEEAGELDLRLCHRTKVASNQFIMYRAGSVKPDDLARNDARIVVQVDEGAEFPVIQDVTGIAPADMEFLGAKVRNFWDATGISQVSAAARREQGISSGVALQTLNDTKQGRQLVKAQRYEQLYVDLAHQYVWRLRELAEEDKNFAVSYPGKALLRSYKWAENDVEDDMFSITVAPSSALPHDPAGRQEMVSVLYSQGMISQETAKSLIGWPDLESELSVENAEYEYIDALIERYTDAEQDTWGAADYEAPEGFIMNKMQALRRFASAWFRMRIDMFTLPKEEKLKAEFNAGLLTRYIKELDALMRPPQPVAPAGGPPGAAPPMPPPGAGMPAGPPGGGPADMLPAPPMPPPIAA